MALPGLVAFASLNLGTRAVPIVVSVVLHAGIAVGLVASASGHSLAGRAYPTVEITIDVDPLEAVAPPVVPEPETVKTVAAPTHSHPYPVDPSHDARPHDPSLAHDHDSSPHDHPEHAPEAAAPAQVVEPAALPRFDLRSGSGSPLSNRVVSRAPAGDDGPHAGDGDGTGAGSDDVVHAASAVQVPARLVQSVAPAYPAHARADDVEGEVGVEIVVDREGRVVEARVTRAAGHGFDASALNAVRGYRFSAAQRDGHAVRVRMPWAVQFRLR